MIHVLSKRIQDIFPLINRKEEFCQKHGGRGWSGGERIKHQPEERIKHQPEERVASDQVTSIGKE